MIGRHLPQSAFGAWGYGGTAVALPRLTMPVVRCLPDPGIINPCYVMQRSSMVAITYTLAYTAHGLPGEPQEYAES